MAVVQWIVWILLAVLLAVSIAAVVRLMAALSELTATIESTRKDVDRTVAKVDTIASSVQALINEEVSPTLKLTRQTIQHLEITARAAADTTVAARNAMERVDSVMQNSKLAAAGGALAKIALQKGASGASGMVSGAASGIGHLLLSAIKNRFTRPVKAEPSEPTRNADRKRPALPAHK